MNEIGIILLSVLGCFGILLLIMNNENGQKFMSLLFNIGYFVMPIIQFFAIWDWFTGYAEFGSVVGFILSVLITYIPVVGSILGIMGAHVVWGWSLFDSVLLFTWFWIIFLLMIIATATIERLKK